MNKKKAIKIVAASAIAASAFAAVAPTQSQAATSVATTVTNAQKAMKAPFDKYYQTGITKKTVSAATVQALITKGEKAYADATAVVKKSGGKSAKTYQAKLDGYKKYLDRSKAYVAGLGSLSKVYANADAALKANTVAELEKAQAELKDPKNQGHVGISKIYGPVVREVLTGAFNRLSQARLVKVEAALEELAIPKVASVSAINLKQVVVTFNKDVDTATAEVVGNYTFASGSGVSVTDADVNGKTVTLTVSGANQQQTTDLTVEGVKVADGTVVAKTTKSVKFVDTVAPTVSSVDSVGPKTIKVKFSEPLQSAPIFSLNDGTIAIVSTAFTAGSDEATLTLGTAPASGTYKLKVKDGLDYAGFKIDEVVKEFTFAVDTVAPVLTVKSASPTQIVLTSNEDITGVTDSNVEFFHTYNGVAAYKATKSVNGKEITLTFANPLPEGAFKLFLNYADEKGTQIADLWGNKVAEQTITGSVVSDTTAPTVAKVEADGNTAIKVTYSEAVTGATTAANYEIKDAAGNTVSINGSITNVSGNTYSIPVAALNGGSYTLNIKNIKDTSINQNKLADYSSTVSIKDVVAPTVTDLDITATGTQAQLLSNKKVKIVFSEAMDKASIENKLNYLFGGVALDSKVAVTAVDNNKAVVLDFTDVTSGSQTTPGSATLQVLRVADAAGNPIAAASTDVKVPAGVTAPLFDKAEVTGKNTVKLYFKEVITSAQAADFLVTADNNTYLAAGSISNEVIDGKSVITLTTSQDLPTTATNVKVKTAGTVTAKNNFGSLVSIAPTAAGDKYGPLATTATAIDSNVNGKVDSFKVEFSENLYVASVQDSDFTVEGYEVTGVSVTGDTVTLSVKEKTATDLTATPKVTLVGSVEDVARNARSTQDALTAVSAQAGTQAAVDAEAAKITKASVEGAGLADGDNVLTKAQALVASGYTVTLTDSQNSAIAANGDVTQPATTATSDATGNVIFTVTKGGLSKTVTVSLTVAKKTV